MISPGGNKKRFQRSFDAPKWRPEIPAQAAESEPESFEPSPAVRVLSGCQRCQLPLLGEPLAVGVQTKQSRLHYQFCESCDESLDRWLSGTRDDLQRPRKGRKFRSHQTAGPDRASTGPGGPPHAHSLTRQGSLERRRRLFLVVGSVVAGTLVVIVGILLAFLLGGSGVK